MKSRLKIMPFLAALMLLVPVFAYSMKISFFLGQASVTRDGKTASIKSGDIIKDGDLIKTGKGGIVEVLYDDNSKITIRENTVVQIGSKNIKGSSDLTVIAGEITGKFGKLKKGVHRINTPTTVCSVRGTEFGVSVSKGGDSLVNLEEGSLDIDNAYEEVKLEKGQSIEAEMGEKPDVKNRLKNAEKWESDMNEDVADDIEDRTGKYSEQFDQFEANSEKNRTEMQNLSDKTSKVSSKDDLEKAGLEIAEAEEDIEHDILMNEASKLSVENLMQDYEGSEQYDELRKVSDKGDAVMEQQKKNYEAIQKVKQEYKEAYDRIMKKYKSDKTKIYKDLEDYKKRMHEDKEQQ